MRRIIFILLIFSIWFRASYAQQNEQNSTDKKESNKVISFAFHPLYLLNNTIKLDVDFQPLSQRLAYVGGVEIYTGKILNIYSLSNNFEERVFDKIGGFGLNAALKLKILPEKFSYYYLSPGLTWRSLNIKMDGPMYYSELQDGLNYIYYGRHQRNEYIAPWVTYLSLGRYINFYGFVIDVSYGIGYKFLNQNNSLLQERKYHNMSYGYNFTGFVSRFELKVGFQLNR